MLMVAHRGASAYEPENTLKSLKLAFEMGANAVEFDIRSTKDGEIILMHDARLLRMARMIARIGSLTLEQIHKVKISKREPIPTLRDALRLCAKKKGVAVVEFKVQGMELRAIELFHKSKRVIAISYMPEVLAHLKTLMPTLPTGILFKKKVEDIESFLAWAGTMKVDWIVGKSGVVTSRLVEKAHQKGFKVMVWVLNRKKTIEKFISYGVDAIETNKPDLFGQL